MTFIPSDWFNNDICVRQSPAGPMEVCRRIEVILRWLPCLEQEDVKFLKPLPLFFTSTFTELAPSIWLKWISKATIIHLGKISVGKFQGHEEMEVETRKVRLDWIDYVLWQIHEDLPCQAEFLAEHEAYILAI